ncbi:MAG TPA: NAD(P)-dependent oxidoreductase [Solirubrobacteraceae bacterium]|nr:NAD(P)-dependent oxidoreductase [Solirubrobacteraceae bacterium]
MRLLITGDAGFLGRKLKAELMSRGSEVTGCDLLTGGPDLAEQGSFGRHLDGGMERPDMVLHLAAQPGRLFGQESVENTVRNNVAATIEIATTCQEAALRLCYVSTSEVYGSSGSLCDERHACCPRNVYGLTKLWGEDACRTLAPGRLLIIRPSMPYGPDQPHGHGRCALTTFIANALQDKESTVHRETARSWCYVDDLIRGMADVVERGDGVYNVGRDDDMRSTLEVAELAYRICGKVPKIGVVNPEKSITPTKVLSMERLRSLGWQPLVDLETGIAMTAESLSMGAEGASLAGRLAAPLANGT